MKQEEVGNKITLNLAIGEDVEQLDLSDIQMESCEPSNEELETPQLQNIPEYFKFAPQMTLNELEWTVTLSRNDFPWHQICFEPFTAKECYKMYRSMVTDAQSFLKKVLGERHKFQRMMMNQINGHPTSDQMLNIFQKMPPDAFQNGLVLGNKNLLTKSLFGITQEGSNVISPIIPLKDGGTLNTSLYCTCKGAIISDLMVACETGEDHCVNGGWVHPQCSKILKNLSDSQIDGIDIFYCEDCVAKK